MNTKSHDSLFFLLLVLLGVTAVFFIIGFDAVPSLSRVNDERLCVVLDAGHGALYLYFKNSSVFQSPFLLLTDPYILCISRQ